jgi:hypothetical protein
VPAQQSTDRGTRDGHEAVVSGHALVRYKDEDGDWQTLKRPGSDSRFNTDQGAAIKGATSGAIVKAFSTLGVGRELYGKHAPRRLELDLIRLTLPRWVEQATTPLPVMPSEPAELRETATPDMRTAHQKAVEQFETAKRRLASAERTREAGRLSLNAQLKQEAMTWRAESEDRRKLTGAELSAAFCVAHGFTATGELSAEQKAALITEAIECRRGVRPYPDAAVEAVAA